MKFAFAVAALALAVERVAGEAYHFPSLPPLPTPSSLSLPPFSVPTSLPTSIPTKSFGTAGPSAKLPGTFTSIFSTPTVVIPTGKYPISKWPLHPSGVSSGFKTYTITVTAPYKPKKT